MSRNRVRSSNRDNADEQNTSSVKPFNFQDIWLSSETLSLLKDKKLNAKDLVLLVMIHLMGGQNKSCYFSNGYIAQQLGYAHSDKAKQALAKLKKLRVLEIDQNQDRRQLIAYIDCDLEIKPDLYYDPLNDFDFVMQPMRLPARAFRYLLDGSLSVAEIVLLAVINSLTKSRSVGCTATNDTLANFMGVSVRAVQAMLTDLESIHALYRWGPGLYVRRMLWNTWRFHVPKNNQLDT